MSSATVADLKRIDADDLSTLLVSPSASTVAVVDVRDDDHVGGHIKDSIHAPTPSLDYRIPELVRKLAEKEKVVFHCALSQQRGPSAAMRYLRERQQKVEKGDLPDENKTGQQVYVLDRGFVGWQKKFGKDERLTEDYAADIWEDYD